jgi:hypothetical protein
MSFVAALATYVRSLPDDAILELVRQRLGEGADRVGVQAKAAAPGPRARATGGGDLLARVEDVVRGSRGMALAEVARALKESDKRRVGTALRTLRAQGRVACAGDRRGARWAGNQAVADAAVRQG